MDNIWSHLLRFLKRKKTIIIMTIILVGFIISTLFSAVFQKTIRAQEIESVVNTTYKNKQFKSITETDISTLLKNKELTIIGIIDVSDNKAYSDLSKMFNAKETISGLPETVNIYQPIYGSSKINKELAIKDKNTFIVIEEGKELGRYSFNNLSAGYEEVVNKIEEITNPKISRKQPVRKDKTEESSSEITTNSDGEFSTSEVQFE